MLENGFANDVFAQGAFSRDSQYLKFGCLGGDVRIEASSGGGQQIHWDGSAGILRLQAIGVSLHACD